MASDNSDLKSIIVVIAGRPYPLRVKPREEKGVKAMVDQINERFNDYQVKFSGRDQTDCLVMTLLTYADELRTARNNSDGGQGSELTDRLTTLNELVEGML
ncbi:cell division protein ZapA [Neolewinella antarctica]|uniref:Cell division protein ZapA n=1 Tax=Neolewinella antarctica TaxID=442734 RepID=A0ABX0XG37_9BACT|nr:cell division protein ZapA [Neolewinella antarctica]NJC27846.1 cell division protein ZapA [Neolewinella antarctica]